MTLLGGYKKETAKMILEVVRYLKDSGYVIERPNRGQQLLMPPDAPIYIRNDADVEIPAFGCVQTTGAVDYGGQNYITVAKPVDNDGTSGKYLFNSRAPIEVGGYGVAYAGPLVRVLTDGSPVVCGDQWQPVVNSFLLSTGGTLFTAVGLDDIATDCMRAFVNSGGGGGATIQFTVDSVATAGSSSPYNGKKVATVTIEVAPCSRSSLIGEQVEVVDWSGCIWDLDEADLIGVWGWATEYVALSLKSGDPPGTLTPCHWAADDRCCVDSDLAAAPIEPAAAATAVDYTLDATTDTGVLVDASSAITTITLPSAVLNANVQFFIKKIDSTGNTVIVDPTGNELIDGGKTKTLAEQYSALTVYSDGATWHIL